MLTSFAAVLSPMCRAEGRSMAWVQLGGVYHSGWFGGWENIKVNALVGGGE